MGGKMSGNMSGRVEAPVLRLEYRRRLQAPERQS